MANLQKIVKVTQAQYDVLASGGTVGSYTGLDDNYIYLIEDTNEYITSNGGTINGGNIDFYNSCGIAKIDETNNVFAGFCIDYFGDELIYNNENNYKILFANDSYPLIYSNNDDYLQDFTFNTKTLRIYDSDDTGAYLAIDAEQNMIYSSSYDYFLPLSSGTLALTSDLNSRVDKTFLNANEFSSFSTYAVDDKVTYQGKLYKCTTAITTAGNWDASKWTEITLGDYVDLTSNQTITGTKNFHNITVNQILGENSQDYWSSNTIRPVANDTYDLGSSSLKWKNVYVGSYAHIPAIKDANGVVRLTIGTNGIMNLTSNIYPTSDNALLLGYTNKRFATVYTNNLSDGTNSVSIANIVTKDTDQVINSTKTFYKPTGDLTYGNIIIDGEEIKLKSYNSGIVTNDSYLSTDTMHLKSLNDINILLENTFTKFNIEVPSGEGIAVPARFITTDESDNDYTLTVPFKTGTIATSEDFVDETSKYQSTSVVVGNATTNINGRVFQNYTATLVTTGGYTFYQILKNGSNPTEDEAKEYMRYMTGSLFLPKYNYDFPKQTIFTFADRSTWKPQYSSNDGLRLYRLTTALALESQIPTVNNATLTITQNSTSIGTFTANASSNVTIDVVTPKVYRYI